MNGLDTVRYIHRGFENFYVNNFLSNVILGTIQLNQEKATTEMQRILYKAQAVNNPAVIDESVEVLNKLIEENDRLLQEYEAANLIAEEKELLEKLKAVNFDYRSAREEVIKAAKNGNFNLAVQLNDQKARTLREEVTNILALMEEKNNQAAINMMGDHKAKSNSLRTVAVILIVIASLLCIVLTILLARMIARPVKILVEHSKLMAEGDFTHDLPDVIEKRKDELGVLASAFSEMNDKIRTMLKEVYVSVEETSASSEELSATVEEISAQGESVSDSVQQIAAGMEEISASVEEVAAASYEIRDRIQKMEGRAKDSEKKVDEIRNRAEKMKELARLSKQTATDIYKHKEKEIKQAIEEVVVVEEITQMADLISEIAGQTNLLALNASIEAARAGEQGRGFAVVAEEVRKLAEHSADTARNIQKVIKQVNHAVDMLTSNTEETRLPVP